MTPFHEIEANFGVDIVTEEVSTIGGLVTSELGRIPDAGERIDIAGLQLEITESDDTRVVEVRIRPAEESPEDEETEGTK